MTPTLLIGGRLDQSEGQIADHTTGPCVGDAIFTWCQLCDMHRISNQALERVERGVEGRVTKGVERVERSGGVGGGRVESVQKKEKGWRGELKEGKKNGESA